jgi:hypothetical protein
MKKLIAAIAFVAATALASPAFAQSSELLVAPRAHSGYGQASPYSAYGAVTPFGSPLQTTNTGREQALRDCNQTAAPFKENTWGSMQIQQYRSCMAQHGQAE